MDGYSLDVYWVENYWFNNFLWWVVGGTFYSLVSRIKCVVRYEDRTNVVSEEVRKYSVPLEG